MEEVVLGLILPKTTLLFIEEKDLKLGGTFLLIFMGESVLQYLV